MATHTKANEKRFKTNEYIPSQASQSPMCAICAAKAVWYEGLCEECYTEVFVIGLTIEEVEIENV